MPRHVRQSLMDVIIIQPPANGAAPPSHSAPSASAKSGKGVLIVGLVLTLMAIGFLAGVLVTREKADGLCCLSIDLGYER